jgi:lipopolysaccharide export system protein LptC
VNTRQTALLLLLILVVVGSGWLLYRHDSSQQQTTVSATGHDSFVYGMDLQVMNANGQLKYHVLADSMRHVPHRERLDLDRPVVDLNREDGTTWHITSERGQTTASGDRIWLLGQVDINRPAIGRTSSLQIRTSDLLVKPDQQLAETDNAVGITTRRYRIDATGLKADFRSNQLQLRSMVRGTFHGAG